LLKFRQIAGYKYLFDNRSALAQFQERTAAATGAIRFHPLRGNLLHMQQLLEVVVPALRDCIA